MFFDFLATCCTLEALVVRFGLVHFAPIPDLDEFSNVALLCLPCAYFLYEPKLDTAAVCACPDFDSTSLFLSSQLSFCLLFSRFCFTLCLFGLHFAHVFSGIVSLYSILLLLLISPLSGAFHSILHFFLEFRSTICFVCSLYFPLPDLPLCLPHLLSTFWRYLRSPWSFLKRHDPDWSHFRQFLRFWTISFLAIFAPLVFQFEGQLSRRSLYIVLILDGLSRSPSYGCSLTDCDF